MTNKALKPIEDHQAPAKFDPPKLDMFNRYKSELVAFEYDDFDQAGKPVTKSWPLDKIGPNTLLIPKKRCRTIKIELEDAMVPAGVGVGEELARRVIGLSRERPLNIPKVFVFQMTRVFSEAPADIGDRVADSLRSSKYPPEVCDAYVAVKLFVDDRRRSLRQVQAQLDEHSRREGEGAAPGELPKLIQKFKSLAPAVKAAVGDDVFQIFWSTLWAVSDDGDTMIIAQPTNTLKILTVPHLAAISKVAGRKVELVVSILPAAGSCKARTGPRPIREVLKDS